MALFPPEEVHFHLNEGRSPKRVVSGPVRVKCIDYVPGGFLAPLCITFLCDFCRTAHFSHQPFLVFLVTACATSCPLMSYNHAFYVHSDTQGCMFWAESEILRSISLSHFALREQANTLLYFDSFLLEFVGCVVLVSTEKTYTSWWQKGKISLSSALNSLTALTVS